MSIITCVNTQCSMSYTVYALNVTMHIMQGYFCRLHHDDMLNSTDVDMIYFNNQESHDYHHYYMPLLYMCCVYRQPPTLTIVGDDCVLLAIQR